jgi:glycyl-tRNA synthetase
LNRQQSPTLQSIILNLQEFWAGQGCLIWQPYHTEVGAGTMNPATYLRVLGPEDWWVAYVEPSIRPADSRYGENPNRWGHYYQFQVILKPDPGDPIQRYLQSLVALGIDPDEHDIRFVEDNWEQPALGAWGLGWEVWLDGQEITQFTYFQQAGGKSLDPVSVEITYGLERIQLALQAADSFIDLAWNEHLTYGEVNLDAERDHSTYIFELADIDRLRRMFDEYEAEAKRCIEEGLIFPAHDYILKCSHTFNLLDGRGAVGVTERAAIFTRMRELARAVTDAYIERREALGFPWRGRWGIETVSTPAVVSGKAPGKATDFVLEIGTEELPAHDLDDAMEQLRMLAEQLFEQSRLEHGPVKVLGTPRRLVVFVEDLAPSQKEIVTFEKGPPADRAFDERGNPTKAAEGFAKSKGISVADLRVDEMNGGRYVVAEVRQRGESAETVLTRELPGLLGNVRFDMSMRWNASQASFSRPVRWILALHGEGVIPFEFAGVYSGRVTHLLRFEEPESVEIRSAKEYFTRVEKSKIILDPAERQEEILRQIRQLAGGIEAEVPDDPALMAEVANLVERPTALLGQFDESFLELPEAVLISVMKKHQRYFPVVRSGRLVPYFIAIRNGGAGHIDVVTRGNEHVISARFADAAYFVKRDLEQPLEAYLPGLASLMFQSDLGSMLDKTKRIEAVTARLGEVLSLSKEEARIAQRGAHLCKADLVTRMVVDMTSLQGEVGREYALRSGEDPAVAEVIREHYLPRFAGDELPASRAGLAVSLADRLDTLTGLFALGLQPTGARDPFALRRAAIGLIQILTANNIRVDLRELLKAAGENLPVEATAESRRVCLEYIVGREQSQLLSEGYAHDAVEAVLSAQGYDPAGAAAAVAELGDWRARDDWPLILQSFARCVRITRSEADLYVIRPALFREESERVLHASLEAAGQANREPGSVNDLLGAFVPLVPEITRFFDEVLVMDEDEELRRNRLGLLQGVSRLADGVIDFSLLEGF